MKDLSIAGFNRINKTGGNIWDIVGANTLLCCMSLKWEKMKEKIARKRSLVLRRREFEEKIQRLSFSLVYLLNKIGD